MRFKGMVFQVHGFFWRKKLKTYQRIALLPQWTGEKKEREKFGVYRTKGNYIIGGLTATHTQVNNRDKLIKNVLFLSFSVQSWVCL